MAGTHSCHSIRIEHRRDPQPAWLQRRKSHTAGRTTDELKMQTLNVSLILKFC